MPLFALIQIYILHSFFVVKVSENIKVKRPFWLTYSSSKKSIDNTIPHLNIHYNKLIASTELHVHMIPLPESANLLSNSELLSLIKVHSDKLQLYISQFQSVEKLQNELNSDKDLLLELREKFIELQKNIDSTNADLDSLRILNSRYTKLWQDLNQTVNRQYSENTLKSKLNEKVSHFEIESNKIETTIIAKEATPEKLDLDDVLYRYINARTNYHLNKEIMSTWNNQGPLKK
ncbi:similar to Saccharomyces cerevisiae YLR119W SRN2 Component of the ESCRT-I complex, which is involved in ubiquitin-dependent sorting of proteins into the endosome [Maudiozyma barnettii]|uniref:Similar to Saccharomyces cerevisiae YLR119W SRN2 Component of the ESCRT-I complex, which is involved in ubiquitin-dependent sorting of proteins into the endosome n=1 Tax=Maudiozyma barnettii TaxID=61262 RepID=A0A8H2ZHJ2_9SACH|nr:ESCRT-I subunit protein SRN2 [Kazachstania barnettii]CAB4254828.1 similar to Saccharomyces cerevisiae YLR119W SRN2 Component of the ESCRT-I complex, which is involved in ubiquitin-dependent sorting of proteins into the endosome [Kazachstania barnettii]CAD1783017.1 similar to Saccharomyces cerevisiae YLR119W SRN2 Component of the ESCRT-I complex, which is involved in ubiquitin-dependent sorting of proteins into the endosome [Kazachstania barnettii]